MESPMSLPIIVLEIFKKHPGSLYFDADNNLFYLFSLFVFI